MRYSVVVWLGALVPACFQPVYEGTACSADGACPAGLRCRLDLNVCTRGAISDAAVVGTDGAVVVDAGIDAMASSDAPSCFGSLPGVCFTTPPTAPVQIPANTVVDTGDSSMCNPNHDQVNTLCVIAGTSFVIPTGITLRATGPKPLVLIATSAMFDLSGNIDVSSKAGTNVGAGGNSQDCVAGAAATGSSGGEGGSFGGKGGDGKTADGFGGVAAAASPTFPSKLRGGCKGGVGANDPRGSGGNGGGAVAVVAPLIVIAGQINASGSGGHGGGARKCGGGGGGAGGMIVIDSPAISLVGTAAIFANGGGGGQGGQGSTFGIGADGGEALDPLTPAIGGRNASAGGGGGGNGAAGTRGKDADTAVDGAGSNGGGGGGGGASGFVRAPGVASTRISPVPE